VTYHAPVPHYRTAAQHAADVLMLRLIDTQLPADFDFHDSLTEIDPHEEDERGWWAGYGEVTE
jgi:hypothetical protein